MRHTCFAIFLILILVTKPAASQTLLEKALKDGIGVRPLGMGGAFTAIADDPNSVFYNPAGLAQLSASYTKGYLDWNNETSKANDYFIIVFPSFGISSWREINLSGEALDVTTISFGSSGENEIAWGLNYKVVRGNLGAQIIDGYSFDFGLKGKVDPKLSWGVMLSDLIEKNLDLPVSGRAGLVYKLYPNVRLAAEVEGRHFKAEAGPAFFAHYGVESQPTDGLKIRAGWERDQFTFGTSFIFPFFTLDYGLATAAKGNAIHRVAFRMGGD